MIKVIISVIATISSLFHAFAVWACCKVAGEANRKFIKNMKKEKDNELI